MATFPNQPEAPIVPGQATENPEDAVLILGDQDITSLDEDITEDDKLGSDGSDANPLSVENEPPEFIRGEVDVSTQIERTTRAIDYKASSPLIRGVRDDDLESLQRDRRGRPDVRNLAVEMDKAAMQGEELHERAAREIEADIEASRAQEEEGQEEEEAPLSGEFVHRDAEEFVNGHSHPPHKHGHPTGAYTDIGAGRSGVTRRPDEKH